MEHKIICITGGTGFVGEEVTSQFLQHGYIVHALIRSERSAKKLSFLKEKYGSRLEFFTGSATEPNDIIPAVSGCSALVHLVGTRREQIKNTGLSYADIDLGSVLASIIAMERTGMGRILLLSAGAIGNSEYIQTKAKAEQAVIDAKLDWTIFRPAFIIGPGQQWPVLMGPILWFLGLSPGKLGDTAKRAGNITRQQLAHAFVTSLEDDKTIRKILEVPELKKISDNNLK